MKNLILNPVFFVGMLVLLLGACSKDNDEPGENPNDTIKLSRKKVEFTTNGGVQVIRTEGKSWSLYRVEMDGNEIYPQNSGGAIPVIKGSWFEVKKENPTTLSVQVQESQEENRRSFKIILRDKDYSATIDVSQRSITGK